MPIAHTDVDGFFQDVIPEFPGYFFFVATVMLTLLSVVFSKHIFSRHNKTFDKSALSCGQHTTGEKCVQAGDA
jgi:hypothetical protein